MKKAILLFISCLSFTFLKAQDKTVHQPTTSDYCLLVKGDTEALMKDGKEVTSDVKLKNGDQLSANGRIMKMDGTEVKLREGDCVTENGQVTRKKR